MTQQPKGGRRKKGPPVGRRPSYVPWLIGGAVILAFVFMVVGLARQPRGPRVGDHWHARYAVEICGETLPPLPPGPGDVHTHGDGLIHIHPSSGAASGRRATLELFFRTSQVQVTESSIAMPAGPTYRNGDACPDGTPGRLRVVVNGREISNFLSYVPQDGDEIRIVFGP